MPLPLVSSILPTRNRAAFIRQALRCFDRQTYENRELVVVDDGDRSVARLCASRPGVTYIRLDSPTPLGTKMNLGIERSRGTIIHKMDDDDYYGPHFLQAAVDRLTGKRISSMIVAWDCFLVLLAGERQLRFSGHGWAAGGTLCFSRRVWRRGPFQDIPRSVDRRFLEDHHYRVARVCAPEMYVLVRHGGNTWNKMDRWRTDDWMRRQPVYPKGMSEILPTQDVRFYQRLLYSKTVR